MDDRSDETDSPLLLDAVAGLANALLDPLLIFGWRPIPGYGLLGAAIATACADDWLGPAPQGPENTAARITKLTTPLAS